MTAAPDVSDHSKSSWFRLTLPRNLIYFAQYTVWFEVTYSVCISEINLSATCQLSIIMPQAFIQHYVYKFNIHCSRYAVFHTAPLDTNYKAPLDDFNVAQITKTEIQLGTNFWFNPHKAYTSQTWQFRRCWSTLKLWAYFRTGTRINTVNSLNLH